MDQLQTAAADVQDDAVLERQAVYGAAEAEARLLVAVGDLDRDCQFLAGAGDELLTVAGFADGGGGDRHGSFGAGAGGVTHQAQGTAGIADHVEVGRTVNAGDQDATAVGADVDDAQRVARRARVPLHTTGSPTAWLGFQWRVVKIARHAPILGAMNTAYYFSHRLFGCLG